MYKLLLLITLFSFTACASKDVGMKLINASPRGLSIMNITDLEQAKAFRQAEIHCAKYYKTPRILSSIKQKQVQTATRTSHFECLKPSN